MRSTEPGPARATASIPNAGKTGTTSDFTDAWFDGYTRDFSTVVWMGYPRGEIPMTDVHGEEVTGATFPVPIWHLYMDAAEKNLPARQFLTPSSYPSLRAVPERLLGLPGYSRCPATGGSDDDDDRRHPRQGPGRPEPEATAGPARRPLTRPTTGPERSAGTTRLGVGRPRRGEQPRCLSSPA